MLLLGAAQHRVNESQEMARAAFRQLRGSPPGSPGSGGAPRCRARGWDRNGPSAWLGLGSPSALGGQRLGGDISSMGTSPRWGHLAGDVSFSGDISSLGTSPSWLGTPTCWGHLPYGLGLSPCWVPAQGLAGEDGCPMHSAVGSGTAGAGTVRCPEGLSPRGFITPRICHPRPSPCPTQSPREGLLGVGSPAALPPRAVQDGAARVPTVAHPRIPRGGSNPRNQTSWGAGVEQSGDVGHVWPP